MLNTTDLAVNCKLCAFGSVCVFWGAFVQTLHAPTTLCFVMEGPTNWWVEMFVGQLSICLIITLRVTRLLLGTWCLTYTLSKVTRLLYMLPGSIQLIWWWNGCVTCLVHVKAHRPILLWNGVMNTPNLSRPSRVFLLLTCELFHFPWLIISEDLKACRIWLHTHKAIRIVRRNR